LPQRGASGRKTGSARNPRMGDGELWSAARS
jgi:hypothetical protein